MLLKIVDGIDFSWILDDFQDFQQLSIFGRKESKEIDYFILVLNEIVFFWKELMKNCINFEISTNNCFSTDENLTIQEEICYQNRMNITSKFYPFFFLMAKTILDQSGNIRKKHQKVVLKLKRAGTKKTNISLLKLIWNRSRKK